MKYLVFGLWLTLIWGSGCDPRAGDGPSGEQYLYLSDGGLDGALASGDVLSVRDEDVIVQNLLTGRDTVLPQSAVRQVLTFGSDGTPRLSGVSDRQRILPITGAGISIDSAWLVSEPFRYVYRDQPYWASFEPSFTGFPEYARPTALDFVNRLVDWSATAPGLEFSEYSLYQQYGRPIIVLSERERGQYLDNQIIIVDSIGPDSFTGRIVSGSPPGEEAITFRRTDGLANAFGPAEFEGEVNSGYSRSYLLLDRNRRGASEPADEKRLPRRSFIDPGDLGAISASFLDDGSVMFLSDDHIVLQGSYVLDLDKGLLTVTDDTGASFRVFVDTEDGISFTLPVSVVELDGGRLVGEDNYLRIDVVGG